MVVAVVVFRSDVVVGGFLADAVKDEFQQVVAGDVVDVDFQAAVVAVAAVVVECGCRTAVGNRSDDDDAVVGYKSPPCLPMLSFSTLKFKCRQTRQEKSTVSLTSFLLILFHQSLVLR